MLTDLVRNQLKDTAKARGISEAEVVDKVGGVEMGSAAWGAGGGNRGRGRLCRAAADCQLATCCSPSNVLPQACQPCRTSVCWPGAAAERRALLSTPPPPLPQVLLADQPTKQFVKPEDVAALVLHLCGPHSSSFTGACLSIDGGWTAR